MRALTGLALAITLASLAGACGARQGAMAAGGLDVDACDREAADPFDVNRWAAGVADADLVPGRAVDRCAASVKASPATARYHYQLGRALLANHRIDDAVASFRKANELGYCAAKYQLGEAAYQSYIDGGDSAQIEKAYALYQQAEQCGYSAAGTRLAELNFSADDFEVPNVIQPLYEGQFEKLNQARPIVALYLQGIHEFMSMEFHPGGPHCPGVVAQAAVGYSLEAAANGDSRAIVPAELFRRFMEFAPTLGLIVDPVYATDVTKYREYFRGLGKRDGQHLVAVYTCEGMVTQNLYDQIVAFARMKKPLTSTVEGIQQLFTTTRELFGEMGVSPANAPPAATQESR